MSENLTSKQRMFVAEYLVDLNAARAAIRAGYGRRDARNAGYRNLRKPKIQAAIAKAQAPRLARLALDADTVLAELARIARANILDYMQIGTDGAPVVDFSGLDHDHAAALSQVVVEEFFPAKADRPARRRIRFSLHNKLAALDKLARHFGLMRQPLDIETPDVPADTPQYDPRQVARAVIAILEQAAIAEKADADSEEPVADISDAIRH